MRHSPIRFTCCQSFLIFLSSCICPCFIFCYPGSRKLRKVYNSGLDKLKEDSDLADLLKTHNKMKFILKQEYSAKYEDPEPNVIAGHDSETV